MHHKKWSKNAYKKLEKKSKFIKKARKNEIDVSILNKSMKMNKKAVATTKKS